jgi:phosphoserine aminotransferase
VAVINTEKPSSEIINYLKSKNMIIGSGYGPGKDSQIRISNFIANGSEQIDNLLKEVEKF